MLEILTRSGRRLRSWLRSSTISGETEIERASERNRRAVASSIAGVLVRGSSFAVVLISVPLTLALLGPVRFGMWMTIASVVALLGATDFGVANGVLNNVSQAFGRGDQTAARQYVASGFVALSVVGVGFAAIFVLLYPLIPWADLYNVASDPLAASEAGPATAVLVATVLVSLPLGVAAAVRSAFQEGFVQSLFAGMGNTLTIALLLVAIYAEATLPILVLAMSIGPIIAAALNLVVLVRFQRPWLAARRSDITTSAMRAVVGVGLVFMLLQIAYIVAFSTDRIVVAQIVGPTAVGDYTVVYRLFAIPAGLASIAILPLWPAYREAISRRDMGWVRITLKRSLAFVLVATIPLAIVLSLIGPAIVKVWTGGELAPAWGLYPAFAMFTVALGIANAYSVLLNGAQELRFQLVIWSAMAVMNIVLSVYLASVIGVAGVAVGSVLATVSMLIIPAVLYVPRLLRRLEGRGEFAGTVVTGSTP
jgi:O-antigen/teichoic acid export membrane protein